MTEYERWLWIADVATETGSLVFLWEGSQGIQPVMMPGYTFYWWLDDPTVHKATEGDGGRSGLAN